ncbi:MULTISPECIES: DUF2986 domain-containing protein [unclassified Agarivorans]|uniref:DUF2986 domain-containing protein n=1 Tax=unclassified Agarivorans TaxID=2636026 RepID=UPI003D7E70FC
MNRKKKINETLKKKAKKANAKNQKTNKPRYVSKAERATLAERDAGIPNDPPLADSESPNQA